MEDDNKQNSTEQTLDQSLDTPDTVVEQKSSGYTLPNPDNKPIKKPLKTLQIF